MSAPPAAQPAEPPWSGWIATTGDALLILEAARRGLIPRVTRRLAEAERKALVTSGAVFVFDEEESGIRRWTDGCFWSPSRILGNFLLYRETERKGEGHGRRKRRRGEGEGGEEDEGGEGEGDAEAEEEEGEEDVGRQGKSLSRPKGEAAGVDRHRERTLVGSLTNSYKFKANGLMKKVCVFVFASLSFFLLSHGIFLSISASPGCVVRRRPASLNFYFSSSRDSFFSFSSLPLPLYLHLLPPTPHPAHLPLSCIASASAF
ncbi:Gti1/Pac2 family-domain-containing protein [Mycena galericulata]|nr:Gti1/Pac2 family-domain-containing protein [Mycena galericulata]